jgi:hypothetical protein
MYMNNVVKKTISYSMIGLLGLMQFGISASPALADPGHGHGKRQHYAKQYQRYEHDKRRQEYERRRRAENERYYREMMRRHNESVHEWRKRQQQENVRHNHALREIALFFFGIAIGSSID